MKIVKLGDLPGDKPSHGNFIKKIMIRDGEIPHIFAFAQVTLNPGDIAEDHDHNGQYEVFLVEKGRVKLIFNKEKEVIAEAGSCIVTEPNETHEVSNPYSEELILTYFQLKV